MAYVSYNHFEKQKLAEFNYLSNQELEQKLELAQNTWQEWRKTCFEHRSALLMKIADELLKQKESMAAFASLEMGKPISQSIAEVEKCAWVCRYYAENGSNFLKDKALVSSAAQSHIAYDPLGTIFAVMPWNFPFWQVFRFIAPAVMAGNTGLLKHASNVPQCALAMEKAFADAGAPAGLFQNLFINHNQVEKVIASPIVKAVTLTGSNDAGSKVAALAGKYLKKSVLELGGSDPFIVFNDANLQGAVENAVMSRFLNTGQSCIAAKRFIIEKEILPQFVHNMQSLVESLVLGNPLNKETYIGTMVSPAALQEIDSQVKRSVAMGAQVVCGGKVSDLNPCIYEPTLLVNVPKDAPVWNEEVFGPVAAIVSFSNEEEAMKLANDTEFGLGATIWTENMERAKHFARYIEAGTVVVNGMVKSEPSLPFGGIKASGYGRELSEIGIHEFVNIKTVNCF